MFQPPWTASYFCYLDGLYALKLSVKINPSFSVSLRYSVLAMKKHKNDLSRRNDMTLSALIWLLRTSHKK